MLEDQEKIRYHYYRYIVRVVPNWELCGIECRNFVDL